MEYQKRSKELRVEALAERSKAEEHTQVAIRLEELAALFENLAAGRPALSRDEEVGPSRPKLKLKPKKRSQPQLASRSVADVTRDVLLVNGGSMKLSEVYDAAQRAGHDMPWPKRNFEAQLYGQKMRNRFHLIDGVLSINNREPAPAPNSTPKTKPGSVRSFVRQALLSVKVPTHHTEAINRLREAGELSADIDDGLFERQFRDAMYHVAKDLRGEGYRIEIRDGTIIPGFNKPEQSQQRFLPYNGLQEKMQHD